MSEASKGASVTSSQDANRLVEFIAGTASANLRQSVIDKSKHHIVDTIAATVSGYHLEVGARALKVVPALGGHAESTVVGHGARLPAWSAAMINAMLAHADETDDSHERSKFHPGCGIVSAALAVAEQRGATGKAFLGAVVAGYDVAARVLEAIGARTQNPAGHSSHAFGGLWGSGAAAAALMEFDAKSSRDLVSYLAHEMSGIACWVTDTDHVQKAYVFGAMGAKNALIAAMLCEAGWTGSVDVFHGDRALLAAYGLQDGGRTLADDWERGDEILQSNIKKWCVGSPIQAALDSLEAMMPDLPADTDQITHIEVELPTDGAFIVAARSMPNISLPHLCSLYLVDRSLTFDSVHDVTRMGNPQVVALSKRLKLIASEELQKQRGRQAIVRVFLADGRVLSHHTEQVRGTWQNPMTQKEVDAKAHELMTPVLGAARSRELLSMLWRLESLSATELQQAIALTVVAKA